MSKEENRRQNTEDRRIGKKQKTAYAENFGGPGNTGYGRQEKRREYWKIGMMETLCYSAYPVNPVKVFYEAVF